MLSGVEITAPARNAAAEIWLRRVLVFFSTLAAAGLLAHLAILLWAENGFSGPEPVVAAQSTMLARDGTLYYDLNSYPYTVCAYTPIFYLLEAGLFKLGIPVFAAGRLISFTALLGIVGLCWRVLIFYTRDRYYAWTGAILCASSALLLFWGSTGQVDTLALLFALAAFERFSSNLLNRDCSLAWAGLLCVLAFFTKQTMLACPAAIVAVLCLERRWKTAAVFATAVGGSVLAIAGIINTVTHGHFLANTVLANINPFSIGKLEDHVKYLLLTAGTLVLIAAAGARQAFGMRAYTPFVYLAIALLVVLATAPKIGSDLNYQMECTILLAVCSCISLKALNLVSLVLGGSKSWVTLLQIPVGVFLVLNLSLSGKQLFVRVFLEQQERKTTALLAPYFTGGAQVITSSYNLATRLAGRIEVETLIYRILVDAKVVNPEPLRRDIAEERFRAIILSEEVGGNY